MRILAIATLAIAAASALGAQAAEQSTPGSAASTRFDGVWAVTLVCADYKDAGLGAKATPSAS